ncbi:MAG: hypothetical protein ACM3UZ_05045 [Acidobacteriota bacterium]
MKNFVPKYSFNVKWNYGFLVFIELMLVTALFAFAFDIVLLAITAFFGAIVIWTGLRLILSISLLSDRLVIHHLLWRKIVIFYQDIEHIGIHYLIAGRKKVRLVCVENDNELKSIFDDLIEEKRIVLLDTTRSDELLREEMNSIAANYFAASCFLLAWIPGTIYGFLAKILHFDLIDFGVSYLLQWIIIVGFPFAVLGISYFWRKSYLKTQDYINDQLGS